MATRYLLQHEYETRPALLVEVVEDAERAVDRIRTTMLDLGCAHALLVDARNVLVLRDTFADTTEASIVEETRFDSRTLLGSPEPLEAAVLKWLQRMSRNWHAVLPKEEWAAPLLYDVVPAVSGSHIEQVNVDAA